MPKRSYSIYFDERLERDIKKIDKGSLRLIFKAISELENFSANSRNIKKLRTPFDGYRKRSGDHRILFKVERDKIFIYAIKHRKDAYK